MKKKILALNKDEKLLEVLVRVLIQYDYDAIGALSIKASQEIQKNEAVDAVLIGGGFTEGEEQEMTTYYSSLKLPVIKHYGGGSGLIKAELDGLFTS